MTETLQHGELLLASRADRTVRGLLLPWNEKSRLSVTSAPVMFARGTVTIPRDVSIITANRGHDRQYPLARATEVEDTEQGIVATFAVADTEEGDELLQDVADRKTSKWARLSAEVRDLVRRGDVAVSAALFGAAFVTEGAFESAALFAIGDVVEEPAELEAVLPFEPVEGVIEVTATELPDSVVVTAGDESATYTNTTTPEEEGTVPVATVPDQFAAANPTPAPATVRDVANALAMFAANGDRRGFEAIQKEDLNASQGTMGMFALSDVKISGANQVGTAMIQPQWIGELWKGKSYSRKVIPLITPATLTGFTITGYRWTTKPEMAEWAGNKAPIASNAPATAAYSETATRYAGGHDIAREFRDFANAETAAFWVSYFEAMTDSYARLTDNAALAKLVSGATAVTAGTVPTGTNKGLVSIVDGALSIIDTATPDFAIVAKDVYRDIALLKDIDKLAFLNAALGLEEGTIASFRVVPHASIAAGKALIGSKSAAKSYELPGSPIRTEALDMVKGGIDEALFGYAAVSVENAAALALVTPAA